MFKGLAAEEACSSSNFQLHETKSLWCGKACVILPGDEKDYRIFNINAFPLERKQHHLRRIPILEAHIYLH